MRFLCIFLFLFCPLGAEQWTLIHPQGETVHLSLSMTHFSLHENPILEIEAETLEPHWGTLERDLEAFSSLHFSPLEVTPHKARYRLEAWDTGSILLGPFSLSFSNTHETLAIPPLALHVSPSQEEGPLLSPHTALLDLTHPFSPSSSLSSSSSFDGESPSSQELEELLAQKRFPWKRILFPLLILALLFLAIRIWKQRKKISPPPSQQSPREKALCALEILLQEKLPVEPFYIRISGICRQYVEEEYHVNAPEKTTQEFLHEARNLALFEPNTDQLLTRFLEHADMVKFARYQATHRECHQAIEAAKHFICADQNA